MFIPIEFQKALQKTQQQAIAITACYTPNPAGLSSRFGGKPYWEKGHEAFVDENDKPLALLAQINFAQLPRLADLPEKGLLQIFIPCDDDYYGANLDEVGGASQVRVKFWQNPQLNNLVDYTAANDENDLLPVFEAHELSFQIKTDSAGLETIECAEALKANPFEVLEDISLNEKEETLFFDAITDYVSAHGHKLLGHPYFIHQDPRSDSEYRLLLQIDTDRDDDNDIMWGDNGIGQIFIRNQDLKEANFEKIWLYWDN